MVPHDSLCTGTISYYGTILHYGTLGVVHTASREPRQVATADMWHTYDMPWRGVPAATACQQVYLTVPTKLSWITCSI